MAPLKMTSNAIRTKPACTILPTDAGKHSGHHFRTGLQLYFVRRLLSRVFPKFSPNKRKPRAPITRIWGTRGDTAGIVQHALSGVASGVAWGEPLFCCRIMLRRQESASSRPPTRSISPSSTASRPSSTVPISLAIWSGRSISSRRCSSLIRLCAQMKVMILSCIS